MLRCLLHAAAANSALKRSFATAPQPGCFAGIAGLYDASRWTGLASEAVAECQSLLDRIITSPPSAAAMVQALDDMSDALCRVMDAAEFCRNVHVDPEWRAAAGKVCVDLGAFVHELNTNYGLYTALVRSLPDGCGTSDDQLQIRSTHGAAQTISGVDSSAERETILVGRMLQRDFERFGVHLEGGERDRMATLVAESQLLGFQFSQNVQDPRKCGLLEVTGAHARAVARLPHATQRAFRPMQESSLAARRSGSIVGLAAPGLTPTLNSVMCNSDDEALRRAAWKVSMSNPADNIAVLDQLLSVRHEMAQLMGYSSYSQYQLHDFSLAGTPTAVDTFLEGLSLAVNPLAAEEASRLLPHQQKETGQERLKPWNRYWAGALAIRDTMIDRAHDISRYVTLDGCVAGAAELIRRLMGVRMREESPQTGEVWAPGVRKLVVEHPEEGLLGVVYLDLFARKDKFPGAAHFTLRCGRRSSTGTYQTPVVAVVASFAPPTAGGIGISDMETLLHELGHALHSLLSRTRYQHLSGTRGPHDMIEIPSHVFERFASEPSALAVLGKASSGQAPPTEVIDALVAAKRHCAALNLQSTLQLCVLDQQLHGSQPPMGLDAHKKVAQAMYRQHGVLGVETGALPQLRFVHLVGYGAGYYTYLFAQALSASLWRDAACIQGSVSDRHGEPSWSSSVGFGDASRENDANGYNWPNGELLRRKLLEPGGAKEPRTYIQGLFAGKKNVLVDVPGGGCYPEYESLLEVVSMK